MAYVPPPGRYAVQNAHPDELRRLQMLEAGYDPRSVERLRSMGIAPGATVLEVGAGAGSMTRWFADAVGPEGSVLAVDIDTRFVDDLNLPNVEVRQLDIIDDDLPADGYDLIHTRCLLMHLEARDQVFVKLVGALRPGGVLFLEEADGFPAAAIAHPVVRKVGTQVTAVWNWARNLPQLMSDAGLTDVQVDVDLAFFNGGSGTARFWMETIGRVRHMLVNKEILEARGRPFLGVTENDIEETFRLLQDPGFWMTLTAGIGAWGRKPT